MPPFRDIMIGLATLARSLVACDFAVSGEELFDRLDPRPSVGADQRLDLVVRRRSGGGLSNDPGRSRSSVTPLPAAPYETLPSSA